LPTFGSRTRTNSGNGGTCLLALPRPASDRPLMRPAQGARGLNSGAPAPALPLAVRGCGTRSRLRCPYATAYNRPHAQSVAPDPTAPRRAGGHRQPTRNQPCGRGGGPPNPPLPVAPPSPQRGVASLAVLARAGGTLALAEKGCSLLIPLVVARGQPTPAGRGLCPHTPATRAVTLRPSTLTGTTHTRPSPATPAAPSIFSHSHPHPSRPNTPNPRLVWRIAPVNP